MTVVEEAERKKERLERRQTEADDNFRGRLIALNAWKHLTEIAGLELISVLCFGFVLSCCVSITCSGCPPSVTPTPSHPVDER
jgi:hypothetical protein